MTIMEGSLDTFGGKIAVVTGGGSGIGLALVRELLGRGARVAVCDIHPAALRRLREGAYGGPTEKLIIEDVDVSDRAAMFRFGERVFHEWGEVQMLFNNAGVGGEWGTLFDSSQAAWSWCMSINLNGVVNGIETFVGRMVRSSQRCYVVNTASIAGLLSGPGMGAYSPSKAAVVAVTEGLAGELKGTSVTASVLCPGFVNTDFLDSGRNLASAPKISAENKALMDRREHVRQQMRASMTPDRVAHLTLEGMLRGDLYILTHPEFRKRFETRVAQILSAFDAAQINALDKVPSDAK
jgi:NAD(P)-dependent dehydrogenase (short-subunit alcohol dehydrogenase family)